jgi:hypothetical protein
MPAFQIHLRFDNDDQKTVLVHAKNRFDAEQFALENTAPLTNAREVTSSAEVNLRMPDPDPDKSKPRARRTEGGY